MAKNTTKSGLFKAEKNAQKLPKQLQNNYEKVQKTIFVTPEMIENDPSKSPKCVKFLTESCDFQFH